MRVRWQGTCLWACALVVISSWCHAQSTTPTPEDEYKQQIKVDQDIHPLGDHPFGENISLYDGTLSFEQTDVSLPGNGIALRLGRSLKMADNPGYAFNAQRPFGDWDLNIPRIETITADQANVTAWQTTGPALDRCTYFGPPPAVSSTQGGDPWAADQYWYGYHLIIPGQGSQDLLWRAAQNSLSPSISGMSFPIVTKQNWMISCGVTASDGGEGFLAIAPDGTRYTFAYLVYRPMPPINSPLGTTPQSVSLTSGISPMLANVNILARRDALMYVTQIQDRFGNTVTYSYNGNNLTGITASDGRQLSVNYVSGTALISSITVQSTNAPTRTWTYNYDTTTNPSLPTLTSVQLPDGISTWSYNLNAFQTAAITSEGGDCQANTLPTITGATATGSITHPSGLTGTFTLKPMLHGRSYVPKQCFGFAGSPTTYAAQPNTYYQYSLTSEVLSGAGLPTETWAYGYSPINQSWTSDACASNSSCASTVYTDVTDPDGRDQRYTFSNRFDATEGLLLRSDDYSGVAGSALVRSTVNTYADPAQGPWPAVLGMDPHGRDNMAQVQKWVPPSPPMPTEPSEPSQPSQPSSPDTPPDAPPVVQPGVPAVDQGEHPIMRPDAQAMILFDRFAFYG